MLSFVKPLTHAIGISSLCFISTLSNAQSLCSGQGVVASRFINSSSNNCRVDDRLRYDVISQVTDRYVLEWEVEFAIYQLCDFNSDIRVVYANLETWPSGASTRNGPATIFCSYKPYDFR
jgi:hypothetical protein